MAYTDTTSTASAAAASAASTANIGTDKTFRKITSSQTSTSYTVSYKTFPSITTNSVSSNKYSSAKYYAFGATMYLEDNFDTPLQTGGICFAVANGGRTGYFIQLDSTSNAGAQNAKELTIFKGYTATVNGVSTPGQKRKINDTQVTNIASLNGVYGGKAYNIDVKIKTFDIGVEIKVWVNGFLVTATDKYLAAGTTNAIENKLIPMTKEIGMFGYRGTCYFDYIYGMDITEADFNINTYSVNRYAGQFSKDTINMSFGNLNLYNDTTSDIPDSSIEEFGPTVRELQHTKIKFDNRPVMGTYFSTGSNKYVTVLASKITNFNAEAFILNNASSVVPLQDDITASFYVVGNTINQSGQIENIIELTDNQYIKKEPVIFESKWIQSNEDANALGQWVKTNAVSKGQVVEMEVFGNPILAIGDIISIAYPYQGFEVGGSTRFVINKITQDYSNGGLSTSITCRTL